MPETSPQNSPLIPPSPEVVDQVINDYNTARIGEPAAALGFVMAGQVIQITGVQSHEIVSIFGSPERAEMAVQWGLRAISVVMAIDYARRCINLARLRHRYPGLIEDIN